MIKTPKEMIVNDTPIREPMPAKTNITEDCATTPNCDGQKCRPTQEQETFTFGTLLAGRSIIRDISRDSHFLEFDPICVRGGKVNDISERLLQPGCARYKTVILQVGSNDCVNPEFDYDAFREDYTTLVKIAASVSETVVISGLCPRLDDRLGNIATGNACLSKIANDENCLFVDNDSEFRLSNGSINTSLYHKDGVHLNAKGVAKLASNLELFPKNSRGPSSSFGSKKGGSRKPFSGKRGSNQVNSRLHKRNGNASYDRHENGNSYHSRYYHSQGRNLYDTNENVSCWYCGEHNHTSSVCRHGEAIQCHNCYRYGHKAKNCVGY